MGGCRCVFRDCGVSTSRNPRMHFFHMPCSDPIRMRVWVEMAGKESIMQLSLHQQRNRVVCARHFRDECFMNYKRDRLVNKAIPTLVRLPNGQAFDYSTLTDDGKPTLVTLPTVPPTLMHLLAPPDFECPLAMHELEINLAKPKPVPTKESLRASDSFENESELLELLFPSEEKQRKKRRRIICEKKKTPPTKKPKILNLNAPTTNEDNKSENSEHKDNTNQTEDTIVLTMDEEDADFESQMEFYVGADDHGSNVSAQESANEVKSTNKKNIIQIDSNVLLESAIPISISAIPISKPEHKNLSTELQQEHRNSENERICNERITTLEEQLKNTEQQLKSEQHELKMYTSDNNELMQLNLQLSEENVSLKDYKMQLTLAHNSLLKKISTLEAEKQVLHEANDALEKKCFLLEEQQQQQQQQQESAVDNNKDIETPKPPAAPTKAQLFNGVKKYLSSSMVALVRMEMFGSLERQWKTDERRVTLDLLRLGETVYKFFSDEWRFRLPTLRQAQNWLNEPTDDDEDDL